MKIKLDSRLKAVYDQLDFNTKFADIGSDHGLLCGYAILNGKADYAIATDISEKSIQKAEKLRKDFNLEDKMETRVGNGLSVIGKNEVDTIVISGMGGREIISILENSENKFKKYIFVPHQNAKELRIYLKDNFEVLADYMIVENNKCYDIIVGIIGNTKYDEIELEFGKDNFDTNLDFAEMLVREYKKYTNCLEKAKDDYQKKELKKSLGLIEEAIYRCQQQRN